MLQDDVPDLPAGQDVQERMLAELGELWRTALSSAHHGGGCGCCGAQPVKLDGAWLEQDILFYLQRVRAITDRPGLLDLVEQRQRQPSDGLLPWLRSIAGQHDEAQLAVLYGEIERVLRSLSPMNHASRNFTNKGSARTQW